MKAERLEKLDAALAGIYGGAVGGGDAVATIKSMLDGLAPHNPMAASRNPNQFRFTLMVAALIVFAYQRGYTLTLGDAWSKDEYRDKDGKRAHKVNSLHFDRLAIDLNLFRDGDYLTQSEDHRELGEFWEGLGGSWGGRFNDGNHYSLEYSGRK